jgi:hypothetical protein
LAKYSRADLHHAAWEIPRSAQPSTDYDGTPLQPFAVGIARADVGGDLRLRPAYDGEKSTIDGKDSKPLINALLQSAPLSAPLFLETMAKEDPESLLLKSKITICRGC